MSDGLIARRYSVDVRLKVSAGLLFALSLAVDLCAQTSTGSVLGEVTDQSGSAVAGAAVTLESIDTGQRREAVTNELGQCDFPLVLPGPYKLTARKQGFTTTVLDNINVRVNVVYSAHATLQVGQMTEQVTVAAAAVQ